MTHQLTSLNIKIFADGADKNGLLSMNENPLVQGLTTNPTLMRKAGIDDYESFAKDVLKSIRSKPISFEVFSDDFDEMKRQALKIASWGKNVYVKIPITNSRGESSLPLVRELSDKGIQLNITAVLTVEQVKEISRVLNHDVSSIVSVFAGRIADTGVDPTPIMKESLNILKVLPKSELLWASVREVLNIFQAEQCGCHIITVPNDILTKASKLVGTDLAELSLETIKMFKKDAEGAGYVL